MSIRICPDVAVPLNVGSPSHELARELDAVEPALALASSEHADLARRAIAQRGAATPVVVVDDSTAAGATFLPLAVS